MALHYPELDPEGPTPVQERDHLAEQCTALLGENRCLQFRIENQRHELARLNADGERLRAALEKVARGDDGMDSHTALGMQHIAREALAFQQKPQQED